jgi:hypothetical protein
MLPNVKETECNNYSILSAGCGITIPSCGSYSQVVFVIKDNKFTEFSTHAACRTFEGLGCVPVFEAQRMLAIRLKEAIAERYFYQKDKEIPEGIKQIMFKIRGLVTVDEYDLFVELTKDLYVEYHQ